MKDIKSSLARMAVIAAGVALLAGVARAQNDRPQNQTVPAAFEGRWRLAAPPTRVDAIVDRAVDRAVGAMPFYARPIARPALRDGANVNRWIALEVEGSTVTVRFATGDSYTSRLGQTVRRRSSDGESMRVTQRMRADGTLEQVFDTDEGTRWYLYRLRSDGSLRVEVVTDSPRMPQAMRFTLPYRR